MTVSAIMIGPARPLYSGWMRSVITAESFSMPPRLRTESNQLRRAGFEFGGVSLRSAAAVVQELFGGTHQIESTFRHVVHSSDFGPFTIEIDTSLLKNRRYIQPLRRLGISVERIASRGIEESLLSICSTIVPFEISTPPLPLDQLHLVEALRKGLRRVGTRGTRSSMLYAFGLHINTELPSSDVAYLINIIRAFIVLYPWAKKRVLPDFTRTLSPYIPPYPDQYAQLIASPTYAPSEYQFVADYLYYNPTRNRALDLLPILAEVDLEQVIHAVQEPHLVSPRRAFHYRLPNCLIDESTRTVAHEWNTWVGVESLAENTIKLQHMINEYGDAQRHSLKPFVDRWPDLLQNYLGP